jgi:hypothetical protein
VSAGPENTSMIHALLVIALLGIGGPTIGRPLPQNPTAAARSGEDSREYEMTAEAMFPILLKTFLEGDRDWLVISHDKSTCEIEFEQVPTPRRIGFEATARCEASPKGVRVFIKATLKSRDNRGFAASEKAEAYIRPLFSALTKQVVASKPR